MADKKGWYAQNFQSIYQNPHILTLFIILGMDLQLYTLSTEVISDSRVTMTCVLTKGVNFTGTIQFTVNNQPPGPASSVTQNMISCDPSRSETMTNASGITTLCGDGTNSSAALVKNYTLVISAVTTEHSGNWSCRVRNSSMSYSSLWLQVLSECKLYRGLLHTCSILLYSYKHQYRAMC